MRIVHVVPRAGHPWSGIHTVIIEIAAGLASRGHDVEVWPLYEWDQDEAFAATVARLDAAGVRRVQEPLPTWWWQYGRLSKRIAAAGDAGVVHLHSAFSPTNTSIARKLGLPYVVSPHGGYAPASLRRSRAQKVAYLAVAERRMLKAASLVCALTKAEAGAVRALGREGPIAVVPNGVSEISPNTDPLAFRRFMGIGGARLAVFVGRLDIRHKGLDVLVRGMADAHSWHLALIGPDHLEGKKSIDQLVRQLGIADRIHVLEPRSGQALQDALAAADVFALLSRWEGFPVSLLEALSHGTPAVVSPAVEEVLGVAAAGAGWVTPPHRVAATFADLPSRDEQKWLQRGEAARRLAAEYQWPAVIDRYEAAYADVLSRAST